MKDIERLFLQKVSESGKKGHIHNLADDVDYQYTLNLFGGEALLKKDFPDVYKMICTTKAHHEKIQKEGCDGSTAEAMEGFENSAKIRYIYFNPTTDFATASSIHRTLPSANLMVISQVRDVTNNKSIDGFAVEKPYSGFLEGFAQQRSAQLIQSKDKEFKVTSSFAWITHFDENHDPVFDMLTQDADEFKIMERASIVKSIDVTHPNSIRTGGKSTILIYDRQAQVADKYDYNYHLASVGNKVRMQIPFEGSVTFNGSYKPTGVKKDTFRLQLEHDTFGVINFNKNAWNKIQWKINGNVLSWKFPDNWESYIDKKTFVKGKGFQFYCEMEVNVNFGNTPFPVPIYIVISSEDLAHGDPSYKKINPIDIYWGCLGKDTRVRMGDHSLKLISDVQVGELILDATGNSVKVENIMTGEEKGMVFVESETGDSILLTDEHPILTERGMVMAKNLNAADVLIMENGIRSDVRYVYEKEYHDMVYSLVLEGSASLIGNGFIVGDFASQQKAMAEAAIIESTEKTLLGFQKELKDLFKVIDARLKQPE